MRMSTLAQRPPEGVASSVINYLHLDFRSGTYMMADQIRPLDEILTNYDPGMIDSENGYASFNPTRADHNPHATSALLSLLRPAVNNGCTIIIDWVSNDTTTYTPLMLMADRVPINGAERQIEMSRDTDGGNGLIALMRYHDELQRVVTDDLLEAGRNRVAMNLNTVFGNVRSNGGSINGNPADPIPATGNASMPSVQDAVFFGPVWNGDDEYNGLDGYILSITIRRPVPYHELPNYSIPVDWDGGAPAVWKPPTVTGEPSVGDILVVNPGLWVGQPTFTYRWLRDGDPIDGATLTTYEIVPDDLGTVLSVEEIATNDQGSTTYEVTMPAPVSTAAAVRYTLYSPGADMLITNEKNTVSDRSPSGYPDHPERASAALANRGYRTGKHYLEWHVHGLNYSSGMVSNFVGLANSDFNLGLVSTSNPDWRNDPHAIDKVIAWTSGYPNFVSGNVPGQLNFNNNVLADVHPWWEPSDSPTTPISQVLQMAVEFVDGTDEVKLWVRGQLVDGSGLSDWNGTPSANPATGSGAISVTIGGGLLRPIVRMISSGPSSSNPASISTFFKAEDMLGPIPSGFSAWSEEVTGPTPSNEQARRIIQAMYRGLAPNVSRKAAINDLLTTIGSTILGKIERLYVIGAQDVLASQLDWKTIRRLEPSVNVEGGSPTFTVDRGTAGTGIDYQHTYALHTTEGSTLVTQNSAHTAIWSLTDTAHPTANQAAYEFGARFNNIARAPASGGGGVRVHVNNNTADTFTDVAFKGYTCWSRDNSANALLFKGNSGGSTVTQAKTITRVSQALNSSGAEIHTVQNRSMPGVNQLFAAHRGAALTQAEVQTIYGALRTYAVAIGIDPDA